MLRIGRPLFLALLAASTGCTLELSGLTAEPDAGPPRDAGDIDAAGFDGGPGLDAGDIDAEGFDAGPPLADAGTDCIGWTPQHFDPCGIGAPVPELVANGTYNTDTGEYVGTPARGDLMGEPVTIGGVTARLISVQRFVIPSMARFRVEGSMPLIVAAWDDIVVEGTLDASSRRTGTRGAGSDPSSCIPAGVGEDGDSGTGGGGGGGFGGVGGDGGDGDDNGGGTNGGGGGGALAAPPTNVRGGCDGADSGAHSSRGRARGGAGGGAVQLTARNRIQLSGDALAGGAGGEGGPQNSAAGGGGGGSGGFVGLDAPTVEVTGVIAANGGGGGGGCILSTRGEPGTDGLASTSVAPGGGGSSGATDGGEGGAGSTADGETVTGSDNGGGGGGGGGVGYVIVWSGAFADDGTISPDVTENP